MSHHPRKHIAPSVELTRFDCSVCGIRAQQKWYTIHLFGLAKSPYRDGKPRDKRSQQSLGATPERMFSLANRVWISSCTECNWYCLWVDDRLVWPSGTSGPAPHADMPEDIRHDYHEARAVMDQSPRASAALLRVVVERLCKHLDAKGATLAEKIEHLVEQGLPAELQKLFDATRLIGNDAVHPGKLDLADNRDTVAKLFESVDFIVEEMITRRQRIRVLGDSLSDEIERAARSRDGTKSESA